MKIAVVGAGAAGIVASYLLQRRHEITLYDRNDYIGGHTHTIVLEKGDDAGTPVDTGFIVFNDKTYPTFLRFLAQLGVEKQNSTMCFSYFDERTGLSYGSQTLVCSTQECLQAILLDDDLRDPSLQPPYAEKTA